MVTKPKLTANIAGLKPPVKLATADSFEAVEFEDAAWAGQEAKRVTFENTRLISPDLTGAVLRDSSWIDVFISGGQLGGLNLTGSSLRRLEILRARLSGTVFIEAELRDVLIEDTKLDFANFRFAKLTNVRFSRCHLLEADFSGARLTDVEFAGCDLASADFSGSILQKVDLRSSALESIKGIAGLKGATLSYDQMISLVPELAAGLGIEIKKD